MKNSLFVTLMRFTTLSLLIVLSSPSTGQERNLETEYKFKRYELVLSNVSWDQARAAAQTAGGDLIVISSAGENSHIANWLQTQLSFIRSTTSGVSNGGGAIYVWLGASDTEQEGTWKWVNGVDFYSGNGATGSTVSNRYNNWGSGPLGSEPDDNGFGGQDYAAMGLEAWPTSRASGQGIGEPGEWNDIAESSSTVYVIEYPRDTSNDVVMSPIFAASSGTQSYLRFINPTDTAGEIAIKFSDSNGQVLQEICRIPIGANFAGQLGMNTITSNCSFAESDTTTLSMSYTSDFLGYIQHVVWNPSGGSLTNFSVCSRSAESANYLTNVHSSKITTYPSRISITNTTDTAKSFKLNFSDSQDTSLVVGTWDSPVLSAKGHGLYRISEIETDLGYSPPESGGFHYTVEFNALSTGGVLGHFVDNLDAGVITEFTARCASK
ncbi:MAG: hypothetical protein CMM25_07565 [Rhodospirillaceae bacterium]|nr:hypothetical protein [Rhodospirillaceae bacterium]